jgi:hypothetical protein
MVATNDDILKELINIKNLIAGTYMQQTEAKKTMSIDVEKVIIE